MNTPAVFRIPDNVMIVEDFAFKNCNNLFQLIIPANTKLRYNSFCGCARLRNVIYEPENKFVKTKDDLTPHTMPFQSCPNLVSISIAWENVPIVEYGHFVNKYGLYIN